MIVRDGVELAARLLAGELIVIADVVDVDLRCQLRVQETLRGTAPDPLRVAFRGANLERRAGDPAFEPRIGERAVFVLGPTLDSRGEPDHSGLLAPRGGARARLPIPAEGETAFLDAVRGIVRLQDLPDQAEIDRQVVQWLAGPNPWLIDAGLDFAARFPIDAEGAIERLLDRTNDTTPNRRRRAALAVSQWLQVRAPASPLDSAESESREAGVQALIRLARTDTAPAVRVAAVEQLVRLAPPGGLALLRAIASEDRSQDVRYAAAAGVLELQQDSGDGRSRGLD